ncbi:sensor histidine kinase [Chryseobacterium polytrichastri]|uniref:Histidine kinase n=1 Tax=Chryseobacterium polytrichastri TaxID=1302687 RepID=A0A1M6YH58_9FLAO|nr:histidine kinase [Chryseobacterium polytrichastri]SHL17339.1 Histidine kinase [Chryseobacterium polytrichastri]
MKANKLIYLHIFFWGIYMIGSVLIPYFIFNTERIILNITFFLTSFICFYVNYFMVAPNFFDASKWYKSVIAFLLSASCFVFVRYSVEEILLPATIGLRNYKEGTNFGFYFFDNIFYSSTTIFISTTFWFFKYFVEVEKEKSELIEAKKTAELQALKTQINPHFIFNSLNNIYSLVYQKSDKALPALEELSQLLRYSTKDLEKDFITLDKEIGYIESLIALESLRLKNPELLLVEKNINFPKLNISPMLIVPFVENAFKHGDFREKGFVVKMSDDNKVLHFNLHNFKKDKMKDSTSGIGIENVKKRLEILYPKKHELNIRETESEFIVDLKINFAE